MKRDEIELVNVFITNDESLARSAVSKMCTYKHSKFAAKIVDNHKLDPLEFPMLIERLNKASLRYFLNNDDLCIYQLIDLTRDMPEMLGNIAEDLEFMGKKNKTSWALGISSYIYHNYPNAIIRQSVVKTLSSVNPRVCSGPSQSFSPLEPEHDLIYELPYETIIFVDTLEKLLNVQWTTNIAGIDCEWRPSLVKFQKTQVSIMQIAFENVVYIIDFISLNALPELDEKLCSLMQSDIYKLGVSFEGDRKMLIKCYPHLKAFQNPMNNYIDLVGAYIKVKGLSPGGLAGCCELLLGKSLCKYEQRSNWENRPLRDSQKHYAALDAYVEIKLLQKLIEISGLEVDEFVGEFKKVKNSYPSCESCNSKLHDTKNCKRGKRCKICYRSGHLAMECPH